MFGKVEFVVPMQVMVEMKELAGKKATKKGAVVALELMEKNNVKTVKVGARNADEALKKMASEAVIGTNDKELKGCVKELNGRVLFLRQRKFLELS